jgi:uncharacterized membrane protein
VRLFFSYFAGSFIATTLLVSGVTHLSRPADFTSVIRSHAVFPSGAAGLIAITVALFELLVGALAALSLKPRLSLATQLTTFLAAAGAGIAFWLYLRQLLSNPGGQTTCGCSPLSAPLTKASQAPSIALIIVAAIGLFAAVTGSSESRTSGLEGVLPVLWGMTVSGMTLLYPAAVLQFTFRSDA